MTVKMLNTQAMFDRWYVDDEGRTYNGSIICRGGDVGFTTYGFGRLLKEHPEYEGKYIFISEGSWIQGLLKKVNSDWIYNPRVQHSEYPYIRFQHLENKFKIKLASTCNLSLKTILSKLNPEERRTKKLLSSWFTLFIKEHKERLRRGEFAIVLRWEDRQKGTGSVSLHKFIMTELHFSPCCLARDVVFNSGKKDLEYFLSLLFLRKKHIFTKEEIVSFWETTKENLRSMDQEGFDDWIFDGFREQNLFTLPINIQQQEFFHYSLWGRLVHRYYEWRHWFHCKVTMINPNFPKDRADPKECSNRFIEDYIRRLSS